MDTFTKTFKEISKAHGEPVKEHGEIVLTFHTEKYGSDEQKVFVQFEFDGDGFQNAEVLPKEIEVTEEHPVITKLSNWAATIISDRIATKKRQEEEAKVEAEAKAAAEAEESGE